MQRSDDSIPTIHVAALPIPVGIWSGGADATALAAVVADRPTVPEPVIGRLWFDLSTSSERCNCLSCSPHRF